MRAWYSDAVVEWASIAVVGGVRTWWKMMTRRDYDLKTASVAARAGDRGTARD